MKSSLSNLIKISFYFPKKNLVKKKQELVNLIIKAMHNDGNIKYAGYSNETMLKKDLLYRIGYFDRNNYRALSKKERQNIIKIIMTTLARCNKILPLPTKVFIFIFPWFPSKKDSAFNGSFGFAVYKCVFHLFIAPNIFYEKSIIDSVVHEINHIVSYYYHPDRYARWSLLDHIINEGLAENFREDVLKTKPMPWAIALSKKKAFEILKEIYPKLNSKDEKIHQSVLFGNKNYKRWTGYSIGYWLVKEFKNKNRKFSWEEIIKTKPEDILKSIKIGRSIF
jgi:uncharacterized protein YjaZ